MAVTISRDNVFFAFSPQLKASARIERGQEVLLQTHDCFEGQIRAPSDLVDALEWAHVNPATGPLYISGAQPGDVLRIDLLEIQVNERSSMVATPGDRKTTPL